jgi:TetR/AcrR family transcriptional repressor of nem operon
MQDTRSRLIEATFEEVYSKGYHGTSLSDILITANAKKGAMYHHFSSKKQMVLAMIEEKVQKRIQEFWQALNTCDTDILNLLMSIMKDTTNRDFKRGCPLGNLLQETLIDDEDFASLLTTIIHQWRDLFEKSLQKAKDNDEIHDINIKDTALFLIASLEGTILLAKNSHSPLEFDACMEQLDVYLNSFRKHKH